MPPADVEAEAALLGLTPVLNKNNDAIGYEGQQAQKIEDLVQEIVGGNNAYSVLSGSAHSEFWFLLGGYQGKPPSPVGVSADEHAARRCAVQPGCGTGQRKPPWTRTVTFGPIRMSPRRLSLTPSWTRSSRILRTLCGLRGARRDAPSAQRPTAGQQS